MIFHGASWRHVNGFWCVNVCRPEPVFFFSSLIREEPGRIQAASFASDSMMAWFARMVFRLNGVTTFRVVRNPDCSDFPHFCSERGAVDSVICGFVSTLICRK